MNKVLAKVLLVDTEPGVLADLEHQLSSRYELHTRLSGAEGIEVLRDRGPFPVVVAQLRMPEMDGSRFLNKVQLLSPETERILLVGPEDVETATSAVDDGLILRYLLKPYAKKDLLNAIEAALSRHRQYLTARRILADSKELQILAMEDPLLGVGNRRAMEKDLAQIHSIAVRYLRCYSLILFNIDQFKLYNQRYGSQAGDKALIDITLHINMIIRSADRLYRYGGNELLLLLPETHLEGAGVLARRLLQDIRERRIEHQDGDTGVLTVSAGISGFDARIDSEPDWHTLVARAGEALQRAKTAGCNQIGLPE